MKKLFYSLALAGMVSISTAQAQKNFIDQAYLETTVKADTSVIPDRIFLSITVDEADNKNKKSTEELEKIMEQVLKKLNIDVKKDLSLVDYGSNFKKYFLKGQAVIKQKSYSLLVRDALLAGKVLADLEQAGISNVRIEKVEYSQMEALNQELKFMAMQKAKANAVKMASAIDQTIGKAIFISDNNTYAATPYVMYASQLRMEATMDNVANEPIDIDFQKMKFEIRLEVKFALL